MGAGHSAKSTLGTRGCSPHHRSMTGCSKFVFFGFVQGWPDKFPFILTIEHVCYSFPLTISCFRDFKMEDGKAEIPLNVTVQGDVLVVIYHARSTLGGRLQAKV